VQHTVGWGVACGGRSCCARLLCTAAVHGCCARLPVVGRAGRRVTACVHAGRVQCTGGRACARSNARSEAQHEVGGRAAAQPLQQQQVKATDSSQLRLTLVPTHPFIPLPTVSCRPPGTGRTKKSGAGGKYTWGAQLMSDGDEALDPNDPNYDSGGFDGCLNKRRGVLLRGGPVVGS